MHRRALWESADELVEEFFRADLEVERIAAVLDADVQELSDGELYGVRGGTTRAYIERENGHVLIAVVDIVYYRNSSLPGPVLL